MISLYTLKEKAIRGIEATSPVAQAVEIAELIGAQAFIVDVISSSAKFSGILGRADVEVKAGDIVSVNGGSISVMPRAEFYAMFEDYVEPDPEAPPVETQDQPEPEA